MLATSGMQRIRAIIWISGKQPQTMPILSLSKVLETFGFFLAWIFLGQCVSGTLDPMAQLRLLRT